jgi:hypothetical protein
MRRGQLYYEFALQFQSTLGANGSYVFSANGAYDPNITGVGHQPMGFDQMMLFYNQYCVARSSILVGFAGLTASTNRIGIHLNDAATVVTDRSQLVEGGLMVMDLLGTGNGPQHTMKQLALQCDIPKYFGAKSFDELKQNPNFIGTAAANPAEQVYFHVDLWGGQHSDTQSVTIDVLLSYDIFYFERKHTASS